METNDIITAALQEETLENALVHAFFTKLSDVFKDRGSLETATVSLTSITHEILDEWPNRASKSVPVRPAMTHEFKTDPDVWDAAAIGLKPWELRDLSDRDVRVGDRYVSKKTRYSADQMRCGKPLEYTGDVLFGTVSYIMRGPKFGLPDSLAVMTVEYD